jgi:DnaJ-class molecular chaperone
MELIAKRVRCPTCGGTGKMLTGPACPTCGGSGKIRIWVQAPKRKPG